jgi:DNA-binding NarL/FixJ family response regulator
VYGSRALTARELEVCALLTAGLKNREIGAAMGTTEHVVKNYLRVIFDKTGHHNRVEVALWYLKNEETLCGKN